MRARGRRVFQARRGDADATARGTFVAPTLIELDRIDELEREVFGPVLHVVRYRRARPRRDDRADQRDRLRPDARRPLAHRRDDRAASSPRAHVGNVYVNRNMIGAVVGVQPFGGEGLSGTGPKAGGPLYLYRLLARRPADVMARALGRRRQRRRSRSAARRAPAPLRALQRWADRRRRRARSRRCATASRARRASASRRSSPARPASATSTRCSRAKRCCASRADDADRLVQLAAVLAVGSRALWPSDVAPLRARLPDAVRARIELVDDWTRADGPLRRGPPPRQRRRAAARRPPRWPRAPDRSSASKGLRPGETALPLERLVVERALSVNTAAAGGNATLMTLQ